MGLVEVAEVAGESLKVCGIGLGGDEEVGGEGVLLAEEPGEWRRGCCLA